MASPTRNAPTATRLGTSASSSPQIFTQTVALTECTSTFPRLGWSPDGTLAYLLVGHTQPVTDLARSPDGKTLASSSLDSTIRLWSSEGNLLKVLPGDAGHVFAVAWSPNGRILASGSIVTDTNPTVQWWDHNEQIVKTLSTSGSGGKFYNLAWSPDGKYLLGGATDYKVWRADGEQVFWLADCVSCTPAWAMAWSPDSKLWAIGNENGEVSIYTPSGEKVGAIADRAGTSSLAWSPDSSVLAGATTLWRADGTTIKTLYRQSQFANSVAWSPDGRILASGGSDAIVHLWSPNGQPLGDLQGHTDAIEVVAWSPAGNILASAADDATIRLWTLK